MISTHLRLTPPATGLALLAFVFTASPALSVSQGFPAQNNEPNLALPTAVQESSYTLGPGDRIQIDIFDVPEYSGNNGRYQVLVDGSLNLPLVGTVSVKGLSLKQAGNLLSTKYNRYYKRPYTTVSLLAPRPLVITIAGEVSRPGSYPIALASQEGGIQFPTLTGALKQAGGITQAANVRQVQVRRPQLNNRDQIIAVDLWQFFQTGDRSQDVTLRDGDSIVIPTATAVNLAESVQLADANFAADKAQPINIAIVGEVYRPGSYVVAGNNSRTGAAGGVGQSPGSTAAIDRFPTVTRAIQVAGGIKPLADIRKIQIRRLTRTGTTQTIDVDLLKLLQGGDLLQDAILQAGDTIDIPTATSLSAADATQLASASFSPDSIRVNVVGEVKQPGTVQVPPNVPLNQALLAAGGFDNRRAKKSSVELIRLNPDGTVSRRKVSIDLSKGINDQTNPIMQNNDIIVVGRSGLTAFTDTLGTIVSPLFSVTNFLRIFGLP